MQNMKAVALANEYRNLAVSILIESPTNPRKRFDETSLQELAASIKSQGLLEPLLVREREQEQGRYEVVVGARRRRAAKLAGIEQVPVRVVNLTDAQTIEAQVVENLQREDIHPLEEAMGFRSLLDLKDPKYTIASIAGRAGKSEAYVLGRIKLTELIPPVAEAFLKDKIAVGHALLIAKLPASQQPEAMNACFRNQWGSEGNTPVLIPLRELAAWIESNILMQLASAPFDKQDETLLPKCGSCVNCPKRTGFNKLLFADVRKDSCTDPQCFQAKVDAHLKKTIESRPKLVQISSAWNSREGALLGRSRYVELDIRKTANGKAASSPFQKICNQTIEAIVMDGGRRGQMVKICPDAGCRIHHPNHPSPEQMQRERREERKRIERDKLVITVRHRILAAILERVSAPLKKADLLLVAETMIEYMPHNQALLLAKRNRIESKQESDSVHEQLTKQASKWDEAALCRFLLETSLLHSAYHAPHSDEEADTLMTTATHYRVDTAKLQKNLAAEFASKREKKKKPKTKAKAGTAA